MLISYVFVFFFSSRRRHTRCALVTGVQTCALPICITPVGRWPLRRVLYRADRIARPVTVLPCQPIAPDDGWCDDPADPAYNRPVRLPYPARHERLTRDDHLYDLVVVLGHNDAPVVPGAGSAVFLHLARSDYGLTEGCVALALPELLEVLRSARPGSAMAVMAREDAIADS